MKRLLSTALFVVLAIPPGRALGQGGVVENVRFEVDGVRVLVLYDLVGSGQSYTVASAVEVGTAGFSTMRSVSGDVGKGVTPGLARTIVWDVLADYPDGFESQQITFQITAELEVPKKKRTMLYALVGALVAGAGGTAALLLGGSSADGSDGGSGTPTSGLPVPPGRPPGS